MSEKYDVIGLMSSGIGYAAIVASDLIKQGNDVRFIAHYPVRHTVLRYKNLLDSKFKRSFPGLEKKIRNLEFKDHEKIDQVLDFAQTLSDEEIKEFIKDSPYTFSSGKEVIVHNFWVGLNNFARRYPEEMMLFEDFIQNYSLRFTGEPDTSRIALICDDYLSDGKTLAHSVYDIFRLGYEFIRVDLKSSENGRTFYSGNINVFKEKYNSENIENVYLDIVE